MNVPTLSIGEALMRLPEGRAQAAASEAAVLCAEGVFRNREQIALRVREVILSVTRNRRSARISLAMAERARDALYFLIALDAHLGYGRNPALREELDGMAEGLLEIAEEHCEIPL